MNESGYFGRTSDLLRKAESQLKLSFDGLKDVLEDQQYEKPEQGTRSIPLPKDFSYFGLEREHLIKRTLKTPLATSGHVDDTSKQLDSALNSDYSLDTLPLLLHQYYIDRCDSLQTMERLLMERWTKQMNEGASGGGMKASSVRREQYEDVEQKIRLVRVELEQCRGRSTRLSPSREVFLTKDSHNLLTSVEPDDLLNYLRFLVEKFTVTRKLQQFLEVIQWLPVSMEIELMAEDTMQSLTRDNTDDVSEPAKDEKPDHQFKGSRCLPVKVSFGGRRSQGLVNGKELKERLKALVDEYNVRCDVDSISYVGEETTLCMKVVQAFREEFQKQEQHSSFQTSSDQLRDDDQPKSIITEDMIGREELGPVKFMTRLRSTNNVDPLLENMSKFLRHSDFEKVLRSLKNHVTVLKKQVLHKSINLDGDRSRVGSMTSRRSRDKNKLNELEDVFMAIYTDPSLMRIEKRDSNEAIVRSLQLVNTSRPQTQDKEEFDPIKLLGLIEEEHESSDPSTSSGALLSFHFLRHLKIRDLKKQCYDILCFLIHSKARLTSDHIGESKPKKHFSIARLKCEKDETDLSTDRKMFFSLKDNLEKEIGSPNKFRPVDMEIDDRFETELVRREFNSLEHDLLLIGSHYIERSLLRDSSARKESKTCNIDNNDNNKFNDNNNNVDINDAGERMQPFNREMDFSHYGRSQVDRFEVILHLWSSQAAFLVSLKKLIEFYLDCYLHTCDKTNRCSLQNLLLQLSIVRLPSLDCEEDEDDDEEYFCEYFYLETKSIQLEMSLMEKIKDYLCSSDHKRADCMETNLNNPLSFLHPFHHSIRQSFQKTSKGHRTTSALGRLRSKVTFYSKVVEAWSGMDVLGSSFSAQVQQDLFNGMIMDDPDLVCDLVKSYMSSPENQPSRKSLKEKHLHALTCIATMMDLATARHRMLEATWQTELFVKMYKKLSLALRMEEGNLYLRPIGFEYAKSKTRFGQPQCSLLVNYAENYSSILDRFIPNTLVLSIHELDEMQVGKFSFLTREHIFQLMKNKSSFENVRLSLVVQFATNKLFVCSFRKVLAIRNHKRLFSAPQNSVVENQQCQTLPAVKTESGNKIDPGQSLHGKLPMIPEETTNEDGEKTGSRKLDMKIPFIPKIAANQEIDESRSQDESGKYKRENPMECGYLSIQLEKVSLRDHMLECFLKSCRGISELLKSPEDFQKVKRKYILEFCKNLNKSIFIHECSAKIIELNTSIGRLLKSFPLLRKFFEPLSKLNSIQHDIKQSPQDNKDQTSTNHKPSTDGQSGDDSPSEDFMISSFNKFLEVINNPWLLLTPTVVRQLSQQLASLSSSIIQLEMPPPNLLLVLTPRVAAKRSSGKVAKVTGATKPQPGDPELTSPFLMSLNSCHIYSIFRDWLVKVQSVNDIICMLCSLASVGGARDDKGNAEQCRWGSPESIATEINEIKRCFHFFQCNVCHSSPSSLPPPSLSSTNISNNLKALEFLAMHRDMLLLKFQTLIDIQVGGAIEKMKRRSRKMASDTLEIYLRLKNQVLHELGISSSPSSSLHMDCTFLPLPDIVADSDSAAFKIYPWRNALMMMKDDSPNSNPFVWPTIKDLVHFCFAGFTNEEMKLTNAEFTSLSLALQDIASSPLTNQPTNQNKKSMPATPLPIVEGEEEASLTMQDPTSGGRTTNRTSPIETRAEMKRFLQLMNQLQKVKRLWMDTRFNRNSRADLVRNAYKRDILEPLLTSALKEKVPRSSDPRDVGDDDNDDDVREIICGDDDIRDVDEDAYAEVKEVMTTTEFMEKQITRLLEDIEFQMMDQSRKIMKRETSIIMGREFGGPMKDGALNANVSDEAHLPEQAWSTERMDETPELEEASMLHISKLLGIFTKNLEVDARKNMDLLITSDSIPSIELNGVENHHILNGGGNLNRQVNGETNHDSEDDGVVNGVEGDSFVDIDEETKRQEKAKSINDVSLSMIGHVLGSNNFMVIKRSTYQESQKNLTSAVLGMEDSCSRLHRKTMALYLARIQHLEQENEQLKKRLSIEEEGRETEMVCKMADKFGDVALEVGALRHRVTELEFKMKRRDDEVRERILKEYEASLKRVMASLLASERLYNQHRLQYCNNVFCQINEARKEAVDGLARLSLRMSLRIDADPNSQQQQQKCLEMTEQLKEVQRQNAEVEMKCHLLRTFNFWKLFCAENKTKQKLEDLRKTIEISLRDKAKLIDSFEKEKFILKEQLSALRKSYAILRNEHETVKNTLDKETKDKSVKSHTLEQKIQSVKQVEEACINKIKELNAEVGTKDDLVAHLTEDLQKTMGMKALAEERLKKDVEDARRKLKRERTLKLDAFQEVNRLLGEMQTLGDSNGEVATWASKRSPAPGLCSSMSAKKPRESAKQTTLRCKSAFVRRSGGGRLSAQQNSEEKSVINLSLSGRNSTQIQVTTLIADQIFNNRGPPSQHSLVRAKSANHFGGKAKQNTNKDSLKYLRPSSNFYKSSFL